MIKNLDFTFIGKNSNLKGDFIFSNDTKIAGSIEGKITMNSNAKLTIEIGSNINGIIEGFDIEVYGEFNGDIISKGKVVIFPTGCIEGKIVAKGLEVFPGAILNIAGHATI